MKRRSQHTPKKSMAARSMPARRRVQNVAALSQRIRGIEKSECTQYAPPENWHEPTETESTSYEIVVQRPGAGFRHVLTAKEIRGRLAAMPADALRPLEVVQLSRMTRKKQSFPCYGMQWGPSLYLYPIEESLVEYFAKPPRPAQYNEAKMYGGRWIQDRNEWKLVWTESTIKDFYLNNILMHELGHLLDDRNTSYTDRERYAEWFAIEHGFKKSTRRITKGRSNDRVRRRHHAG